jgi:hypothetical protein
MNRTDFQNLSELRLRESKALLAAGCPDGAYYLAGYAMECALKACIAKRTQQHDFPAKKLAIDSHTHDLAKLLDLAKLKGDLDAEFLTNPHLDAQWEIILRWSEESRYDRRMAYQAQDLLNAIEDGTGGLLPWIRARW